MLRQLLIVTEDPGFVVLAAQTLREGEERTQLHLARSPREADEILDGRNVDVAIIDGSHGELPQTAPLAQRLKNCSVPTLLLTSPTGFPANLVEGLVVVDRPSSAEALAHALDVLLRYHLKRAS